MRFLPVRSGGDTLDVRADEYSQFRQPLSLQDVPQSHYY